MVKTVDELASRWFSGTKLGDAEKKVLKSAAARLPLSKDMNAHYKEKSTLGEHLADTIARVGGSWNFIIAFLAFLVVWTVLNGWLLSRDAFDPYPFIFLNLMLSMLAAIQAPIIMMSQNRQAARDRMDATHDYEVNLKAEIEIMALHEKMDDLRHREIVAMHTEVMAMSERLARLEEVLTNGKSAPT